MPIAYREIRAVYTQETIRIYQAYSNRIADAALEAGTFVPPSFNMERMTWIKPSFLWMMYRSGWAKKAGQERVLAIDITLEGFEWALKNSCLSHYIPKIHSSKEEWLHSKKKTPVRIQWDPERDLRLNKLDHRSIQIGLSGEAVKRYVEDWIIDIKEISSLCNEIHTVLQHGKTEEAQKMLPNEKVFSPSEAIAHHIGIPVSN